MTAHITTEIADRVMTLRFNRPEKKNAITAAMYSAMADACRAAEMDANVRVLVITGSGDSFAAGNDLKDFLDNTPDHDDAPVFQFMAALAHLSKPAIAAVNGTAVGIGATLLLHCDAVYAAPGVKLGFPFVNLAIVPEFGATLLLERFVGARRARELLMSGDTFTSETAVVDGFINAVVPADKLMDTAMAKARSFAAKPPGALRETKKLLTADLPEITARMQIEARELARCFSTPEFKEAGTAFFEKRTPDFSKF